ncbi:uncharacterized protein LOC119466801 [Cebus imitator]|uniref:uncharacterized protein LOC119466801 n=1 Tax=Cebus imitator TaxID=2715852 RepID=UPI00189A6D93|nr:uncharacterized protein LOC119466801 [Cebus imitator]
MFSLLVLAATEQRLDSVIWALLYLRLLVGFRILVPTFCAQVFDKLRNVKILKGTRSTWPSYQPLQGCVVRNGDRYDSFPLHRPESQFPKDFQGPSGGLLYPPTNTVFPHEVRLTEAMRGRGALTTRPEQRPGGRWGRAGPLSASRVPGQSLQVCESLRRPSFRARGAGPSRQARFQPRLTAPSPLCPRARQQQPRLGFPSPPPALSPPAPRPVSGSGSGRRRCRWWRAGDRPGAREQRKLEAAVQKSCEVSSAGGHGSWSGDEEDPRGRSPPGTNGRGRQGPYALGGHGPGRCGALGPVLCAFPGTGRTLFSWVLKNSVGNQETEQGLISHSECGLQ